MTDRAGSFSVLVVCDGNVCRSPAAQFAIGRRLAGVRVESAGMHASTGSRICDVVGTVISAGSEPTSFAESFRSRRISAIDIANFDLVLAATMTLRAELTSANPVYRDRFFTLREAAHILTTLDGALPGTIVQRMDSARGSVPLVAREASGVPMRRVDPFDLPDAHHLRSKKHSAVVSLALSTGDTIGSALARQLELDQQIAEGGA